MGHSNCTKVVFLVLVSDFFLGQCYSGCDLISPGIN